MHVFRFSTEDVSVVGNETRSIIESLRCGMYKYNCSEEAKLLPLVAISLLSLDRPVRFIDPSVNPLQLAVHPSSEWCVPNRNQLESDRSASNPAKRVCCTCIHLQNACIRTVELYTVLNYVNYFTWYVYCTAFCEAYIYDGPQNQIYDFREIYKRSSVLNKTKKNVGGWSAASGNWYR